MKHISMVISSFISGLIILSFSLNIISSLHTPLNNFFDNVMVNVDDVKIKSNRLSILKKVLDTLKVYADFSKIQK